MSQPNINTPNSDLVSSLSQSQSYLSPNFLVILPGLTSSVRLCGVERCPAQQSEEEEEEEEQAARNNNSYTQHRNQPTGTTSLPTPVNPEALSQWLEGYTDRAAIVSIFAQGAMLDYQGINSPLTSANSQSATQHPEAVSQKLQEELSKNRIAGPFSSIPLPQLKISPLALREKQETGKYRLLHNLSFPYDEQSVNYDIPKTSKQVHYESISDAIASIHQCTPTAYMAKSDIADAFRI